MKIWVDVLTPKHYLMTYFMYPELENRHEVLVTGRRYVELEKVVERMPPPFNIEPIGIHGGKGIESKLKASIGRMEGLASWALAKRPDLCISFGSPEAARVAYGLKIPHIMVNDSPHSVHVARLTAPLSSKVLTPWVVPTNAWKRFGVDEVLRYRALDPIAWLRRRKFWPPLTYEEGLCKDAIVIREEERFASYLESDKDGFELAMLIAKRFPEKRVVLLRRYEKGGVERFGNLFVLKGPFFGPNILSQAELFIGRGGTMTAESALLGKPTISDFTLKPTYVERYLLKEGLVDRAEGREELLGLIEKKMSGRREGKDVTRDMIDPIRFISDVIEDF
jgi:hypothetical protein